VLPGNMLEVEICANCIAWQIGPCLFVQIFQGILCRSMFRNTDVKDQGGGGDLSLSSHLCDLKEIMTPSHDKMRKKVLTP
jgi:hypothetical protein